MEKSGFFNAMKVDDTWDRVYKAENFAEYFATFIGNGVFPNPSNQLQVKETDKMQVIVQAGKAWINGFIYINTEDLILDIPVADGVLHRIDKVVLRYDVAKREIRAVVKKGEFNSKPTAPTITRNMDMYELGLADIQVNAGAIKISQSDITDLRLNKNLCGIVHGTVDQVDITTLYNQYTEGFKEKENRFEKDFRAWFETIKGILDEDAAGKLLNSIIKNINDIKEMHNIIKIKKDIVISSSGWERESNIYKYKFIDKDINSNTIVDINIHLEDLDNVDTLKPVTQSFDGYVLLYASDLLKKDIKADFKLVRSI